MITRTFGAACLLALAPLAAAAQTPARSPGPSARFDSAARAWDAGHYPEALERLERLLASADAPAVLQPVALLTGELYHTDSLAADGGELRWSPDGRFAAFVSGVPGDRKLHLVDASRSPRRVITIAGRAPVFAPGSGEMAYLGVIETAEAAALRREADSLVDARDLANAARRRTELARIERETAPIRVRNLRTGRERELRAPGLSPVSLAYAADGQTIYLAGAPPGESGGTGIYALAGSAPLARVVAARAVRTGLRAVPGGRFLVWTEGGSIVVHDLATKESRPFPGRAYSISADGSALAFVRRDSAVHTLLLLPMDSAATPVVVRRGTQALDNPALSPDGRLIAFQKMPREDWELYVIAADGTGERRLTHDIQHDLFPQFAGPNRILGMMGEGRHRRSYLYDLTTGERTRLFHNNSVRTISAEYEWAVSPDATKVLVVAERDGDTISPERSVYLTDLTRMVTVPELQGRVRAARAAETSLRERGRQTFAPFETRVRAAVDAVSVGDIAAYARDLYAFDSKYMTKPGNAKAIEYLAARLREFGYEPELQWFEPRPGVRTANVVARLQGTSDPALVYVVSSHFDSVEEGPGSDDNTSGTSALLEAARVMATRPQRATIEFAFFTGEEAGLFGSREYVRRAVASGKRLVGALNNDMVGFANDERMDNTIRYSSVGLRDLQHAAAFLFTNLVTYDARYYKNTDAHAYYEQYGDIVGGIGSYPILGNPHYHQSHDVLETVNQHLVAEVSRTTIASIIAMASSPARLAGLDVESAGPDATARWRPAAESGVSSYVVTWGPAEDPSPRRITVREPSASLPGAGPGTVVRVRAVGDGGAEGWDWARATVR